MNKYKRYQPEIEAKNADERLEKLIYHIKIKE